MPDLKSAFVASRFTPDMNVVVTRMQVEVLNSTKCTAKPVILIGDGSVFNAIPVDAGANDTGPIQVTFTAGKQIVLRVSTAGNCGGSASANVTVQYRAN